MVGAIIKKEKKEFFAISGYRGYIHLKLGVAYFQGGPRESSMPEYSFRGNYWL